MKLSLKDIYLNCFIVVYALYAYFNKGVAYSFLAEFLLLTGGAFVLFNLPRVVVFKSRPLVILLLFMVATTLSLLFNFRSYPLYPLLQDGSMFYYGLFVLVVFYLSDKLDILKKGLFRVYAFYPIMAFSGFLVVSYVPHADEFILFGKIPFLMYKYGDMAVHLLICTLLMMCGHITMSRSLRLINVLIILYLFLVIAAYNRAGMLAYLIGLVTFLFTYRKRFSMATLYSYIRFAPLLLAVVLAAYANTKVEENFQGRTVGLAQLRQNVVSLFSSDTEGSLSDNKLWRLAWWLQIVTDAVHPKNALVGKGLGVNLAQIGDIKVEDESLRSPHNFHLNILARFGFPVFLLWIYWILIHVKNINVKNDEFSVVALIVMLAFLINAFFDVYLEGPMGAMPFWIWVGILYVHDAHTKTDTAKSS